MNLHEFKNLMDSKKGASFITITALTTPDWIAGKNPYKESVKKRSVVNGVINWIYTTSVNRQRLRENKDPDFAALPRRWGRRIYKTPFVEHKGKYYLELKVERLLSVEYVDTDNNLVPDAAQYIKVPGPTRQEVNKEIVLRDYYVGNILSFTFNQETHEIAA